MKSRPELYAYWRDPPAENAPKKYLGKGRSGRSEFLVRVLAEIGAAPEDSILEIGCNAGRNLLHLWKAGYRDLAGIEINPAAVDLMRRRLPFLDADVRVGPVEELLTTFPAVDGIYTVAVLVHLHPESEFVFAEMARLARKWIVTIEDERSNRSRHCARDYRAVFEGLGLRQVYYAPAVPGLNGFYCARAFAAQALAAQALAAQALAAQALVAQALVKGQGPR